MMEITRRAFIKSGLALASTSMVAPGFLTRLAAAPALMAGPAALEDRVLVLLQLAGGNDGLNTVIPYADPLYRTHRPRIGIAAEEVLALDDAVGLHPSLVALKALFDAQQVAIVQGVGYPEPDRSHFVGTDIFQTASPGHPQGTGWIGWMNDGAGDADKRLGRIFPAVTLGGQVSGALKGGATATPAIRSIDEFRMLGKEQDAAQRKSDLDAFVKLQKCDGNHLARAAFMQAEMLDAYVSSENLKSLVGAYQSKVNYPQGGLAAQLKLAAQMIASPLRVRTYHVSLGGFDTHSQQLQGHAQLFTALGGALDAFQKDLADMGAADRVLVMTYSEFGRRVKENGSLGTDHGAGQPSFLVGAGVKGGVYGAHPSLEEEALDRGDLKWHTDFRSVYAAVLQNWFGVDPKSVLGQAFEALPVLRA